MKKVFCFFTIIVILVNCTITKLSKLSSNYFFLDSFKKYSSPKKTSKIIAFEYEDYRSILLNYKEIQIKCITDTIVSMSLNVFKKQNKESYKEIQFYKKQSKLVYYGNDFSTKYKKLYSIISYANSNFVQIFLVSMDNNGGLNFIKQVACYGGDAGYGLDKNMYFANDSTFLVISKETNIDFDELGKPNQQTIDSSITTFKISLNSELWESRKHFRKTNHI